MRVKVPKSYDQLSTQDKAKLKEFVQSVALEAAQLQIEKDNRVMLESYIKMACIVLHDAFGFGEKRLTMFIGNHKRLFKRQVKLVSRGEQVEYLDRRMSEIFKKGGFPQDFIDSIFKGEK